MSKKEIGPCPFCRDTEVELVHDENYDSVLPMQNEFHNGAWYVICTMCGCQGPPCGDTADYKGKDLALELWNSAKR